MARVIKCFQAVEFDDGSVRIMSNSKRQMARWYGLDYLKDKAQITDNGNFLAELSPDFCFAPAFRRKEKKR